MNNQTHAPTANADGSVLPYAGDTQPDEPTQQTQADSQDVKQPPPDDHLWGYLLPHNPHLARVDFWKIRARYRIGRRETDNDCVFPGSKISNCHAVVHWDGVEGKDSTVIVTDLSSNGTYVSGAKIGKNQTAILQDGQEICFGSPMAQMRNGGLEDYRFVFRNLTIERPSGGLYAYYDIGQEIGAGSFATVKRAMHRATGKWYAVKIIQKKHRQEAEKEQVVRETSVMEQLSHPNIVLMQDTFFEDDGGINIVMEMMHGGDLLAYILHNGGLTEWATQQIAYQISDALAYIHSIGIAHRDLKPENILLTDDPTPIAKVADFGLAKIVDSMTMLKTMCGTPSYLAPEVVIGAPNGYSLRVDSWSVGVIIFSALTNASPFIEESHLEIRARIQMRQVDWNLLQECPKQREGISPLCHRFISELLQNDPVARLGMQDAPQHEWFNPKNGFDPVYGWAAEHLANAPHPSQSSSQSQSTYGYSQQSAGSAHGLSQDVSMLTAGAGDQGSTEAGGSSGATIRAVEEGEGTDDAGSEGEEEEAEDELNADATMRGASSAAMVDHTPAAMTVAARKRVRGELSEDAVMASPMKRGRTGEQEPSPDASSDESDGGNPLDRPAPSRRPGASRRVSGRPRTNAA